MKNALAYLLIALAAVALIAVLAVTKYGEAPDGRQFDAACKESGGKVVLNGRQRLCIKPAPPANAQVHREPHDD